MPKSSPQNKQSKIILASVVILVLFVSVFPTNVLAQMAAVTDPGYTLERSVQQSKVEITKSLSFVFFQSVMNSVNYFLQKVAYDTAVWVASGGKAQVPLFDSRKVGKYLEDTALDSAGEFLGTFSKAGLWSDLGLDLCTPTLPEVKLRINLGAINSLAPIPKCTANQIKQNYATLEHSLESGAFLNKVGLQFTGGGQSELGTALDFNEGLRQHVLATQQSAQIDRVINKGYKAVTTALSDKVTTPSDVVEQIAKQNIKSPNDEIEWKAQQVFLNKDVLLGAAQNIGKLFLKTLAGKLIERAKNGFFSVNDLLGEQKKSLRDIAGGGASPSGSSGKQSAQRLFADLLAPAILDVAQYNPLNEYTNCPEEFRGKTFKTLSSCVLDQSFLQAIEQKLTIRQAVDQGLLHGEWPLVSPQSSDNADPFCYTNKYCYGNLAKLRKLRIVPVGFEFAAATSNPTNPATLSVALANFNNCNSSGFRDAVHPFCHLLDENWVLKYPETQCHVKVFGATLAGWDASEREEVCADTPSCLSEDSSGKCTGGFAYCTKEKNIWNIGGDSCPAQFASCRTYVQKNGQEVSYLSNTLDNNACSPSNVGCLAYRIVQETTGNWNAANKIYLNGQAEDCDLSSVGCTKLALASSIADTNLLVNGGFETDANLDSIPDQWKLDSDVPPNGNITPNQNPILAYEGNVYMVIKSGHAVTHNDAPILSNQIYSLSFWAKSGAAGVANASAFFTFYDVNSVKIGGVLQRSFTAGATYQVNQFTVQSPSAAVRVSIAIGTDASPGGQTLNLDNVLFEQGNTYQNADLAYLKKAPDYLGCTGEVGEPLACGQYASQCKKSEVGCQLYHPLDGGLDIPGSTKPEDACPSECAGYAALTQKQSNFEAQDTTQYFIPDTAKSCSLANVGCSAFTNLSNEKVENYTYLRSCQKSETDASIFYTWEGSDTTGYQLKTWRLKKDSINNGPCTKLNSTGSCGDDGVYGVCAKNNLLSNPDCREFLDKTNQPFYRLYSKTIVVSDQCVSFRKTDSDPATCQATGGMFDTVVDACVYNGLPTENVSCPKEENNCRAFNGTTSGNVRQVFSDTFESGLAGWTNGVISSESLVVGGHSLRVSTTLATKNVSDSKSGLAYTVTFWSKGTTSVMPLTVSMFGKNITIKVTQIWRPYTVGPFVAPAIISNSSVSLVSTADVFVDNVVTLERQGEFYSIVKSWVTPASCDNPVPQAQLGCVAYKTLPRPGTGEASQTVYLKSFDNLCRPEKVGCGAFVDMKNSDTIGDETFNAVCRLDAVATSDTPCADTAGTTLCTVSNGSQDCRYTTAGGGPATLCASLSGAGVCRDSSTYTNPGDTYTYLVDDGAKQCTADKAGCTLLGQEQINGSNAVKGTGVKVDTNSFGSTLCLAEAVSCEEYRTDDSVAYFKNPSNKLCEWREGVPVGSNNYNGWFKKGTNDPCEPIGLNSNVYQIKRNGDLGYAGFVGMCDNSQNKCTEFIDPADTSDSASGKSYFFIKNDKITGGDCGGSASQKQGCVLFNDMSNLNVTYASKETYDASVAAQNKKVPPEACGVTTKCTLTGLVTDPMTGLSTEVCKKSVQVIKKCDSNTVLEVHQDRQCGEWLACRTKATTWDNGSGRFKDLCLSVAACQKFVTTAKGLECAEFAPVNSSPPLTIDAYAGRDVSFSSPEYSGYSIPNVYPLGELETIDVSVASSPTRDWRLVKNWGTCPTEGSSCSSGVVCLAGDPTCPPSEGICLKNKCVQFVDGTVPQSTVGNIVSQKPFNDVTKAPNNICRGFPEKDSPFSERVAPKGALGETRLPGFANASLCTLGDCECLYQKVEVANEARYFTFGYFDASKNTTSTSGGPIPTNLCKGGSRDGQTCNPSFSADVSCPADAAGNKGTCERVTKINEYAGLLGKCVERDYTTTINGATDQFACLTWFPTDLSKGGLDVYNLNKSAVFVPASPNEKSKFGYRFDYNINFGPLNGLTLNMGTSYVPAIGSVKCFGNKCALEALDKISVDGIGNNHVVISPKSIKAVTVSFYAWADNDQTPLKEMSIIWGDGKEEVLNGGYYKNHKPYCNQDDYSETAGAGYCYLNQTVTDPADGGNYTCATSNECTQFATSDNPSPICKKAQVCSKDPVNFCSSEDAAIICKGPAMGSCIVNTSSALCAREDGKPFSNGSLTSNSCAGQEKYPVSPETSPDGKTGRDGFCIDKNPIGFSDGTKVICKDVTSEPGFKCSAPIPGGTTIACGGKSDITTCAAQDTGPCVDRRFNGSSIRACDPNPFIFTHTYNCASDTTCRYSVTVKVTDYKNQTKQVINTPFSAVTP